MQKKEKYLAFLNKIFNNSLAKGSITYSLSSIINSAIPFFLMPILTRVLTPADYGITAIYSILISIYNIFIGINLYGAINREYFNKQLDFNRYIFNCIIILLSAFLIVFTFSVLFSKQISSWAKFPSEYLWTAIIASLFFNFQAFLLSIYRAQKNAIKYSVFQIGQTFINFALSIILVVLLKKGWQGRIYANLIASVSFGIFALIILLFNYSKAKISFEYIGKSLKFGLPLIPHALGGLLISLFSRLVIANTLGLADTGLYTAALQIATILSIVEDSFNRAYAPWLYEKLNSNNDHVKLRIVKFTYLYFIVVFIFALMIGLSSPYLVKILLGKDFSKSAPIIIWIAIGAALNGMYYMVTNYIFYAYKTHILAAITITCGVINIPLTIILTKANGAIGAGQAYALAQLLSFVLTWILSSRVYKMPWKCWSQKSS